MYSINEENTTFTLNRVKKKSPTTFILTRLNHKPFSQIIFLDQSYISYDLRSK